MPLLWGKFQITQSFAFPYFLAPADLSPSSGLLLQKPEEKYSEGKCCLKNKQTNQLKKPTKKPQQATKPNPNNETPNEHHLKKNSFPEFV